MSSNSWTECKLGDVLTLQRGFDLPEQDRRLGEVPIVTSSGITGYHDTAKVKGPGVVTGRYGTLGEIFFIAQDYWPHNTTLYVRDFKGNEPRFISYFLRTLRFAAQNAAGAVPGVNRNALHLIPVKVPPLAAQRKIAAILSAYDDLIENNMRRIKMLEEMARLIYREWFVYFRFPGHEQCRMVDSALGNIPEGWEVARVGDIYRTGSGGTPSRKINEYFGGTINWVKTKELQDLFIFETEEKITELGLENSSAKFFPENTVLFAMYGATIGQLGILSQPATTNQACCAIVPDIEEYSYVYAFLTLLLRRHDLIGLRQGAAQQNVNQILIKDFRILKPSTATMKQFNEIANREFELIKNLQHKNINLRRTRDLLLPKLISGEVDVEELDIRVE